MKKKVLAIALTAVMACSLAACGGSPAANESAASSAPAADESTSADPTSTPAADEDSSKAVSSSSASSEAEAGAPDYSKEECWFQIPKITKDVDTFYICATEYTQSSQEKGAPDYAPLDNEEMLSVAPIEYATQASAFEDSTNVFVPYSRQAGLKLEAEVAKRDGNIDAAISGIPYEDITAALDYYFENYNEGRPFIIAGHSQGSAMAKYVLKNYFKEHSDYYERMVAGYLIGYSVTKEDLEDYPYLKFAEGETDTGVLISWNTEGKKNVEQKAFNVPVLPNAIAINPINWKRDETYAPASENLGSYMLNMDTLELSFKDVGADAQVNLERGVVVTNATCEPSALTDLFGPQSYHGDDYSLFYNNIKDNVAKRVAAYLSSAK